MNKLRAVPQGWRYYKRSFVPYLQRELEEPILNWLKRVTNTHTKGCPALEGIHSLYLRAQSSPENISPQFIRDIGIHLRRTFQLALESPTLPAKYRASASVIVLGAGASSDDGMPCTEQLFDAIKKRLGVIWKDILKKYANFNDVEELISAMETVIWSSWAQMQDYPPEYKWLKKLLLAYKHVIVDCQNKARAKRSDEQPAKRLIEHLRGRHGNNWTAISFNQDTVLEHALIATGRWNPRKGGWGLHFANDKRNSIFAPLNPPRVLKPHGCIAWTRDRDRHLIGSTDIDMRTLERHCPLDKTDSKKIPLILAPSYLKQYDDLTIWHTMARVCHELIHATHIRVIGFRLRPDDTLASHVIRMALRLNQQKRSKTKPLVSELVDPNAASDAEGSMGRTWSGVATMLAAKGWTIRRHPVYFRDYVTKCLEGRCDRRCEPS